MGDGRAEIAGRTRIHQRHLPPRYWEGAANVGLNPPLTHDGVMLNDATVVATDVEASNGAIHVIDTVIVTSKVDVDAVLD